MEPDRRRGCPGLREGRASVNRWGPPGAEGKAASGSPQDCPCRLDGSQGRPAGSPGSVGIWDIGLAS